MRPKPRQRLLLSVGLLAAAVIVALAADGLIRNVALVVFAVALVWVVVWGGAVLMKRRFNQRE